MAALCGSVRLDSSSIAFALTSILALVSGAFPGTAHAADPSTAVKSPLSPQESLRHFQLAPGLKIEVVAAEPEVVDPVAIAFDEDARMYVVEMGDYPTGPKPG